MKKFIVNKELFKQYENLSIGIVGCKDIDNNRVLDNIENEMNEVKNSVKEKFRYVELASYPVIRKWRDIYKSFGEKKSHSSVEALIRRTVNGKELSSINPLVDIYNVISLKYELPCGGEDLDTMSEDIYLTYAKGTETFLCLGAETEENPNEGEIVYKSGNMIICRNFNYRESDITKLTENTKNAVLVIEHIEEDTEKLETALKELAQKVQEELGGTTKISILTESENEYQL